MPAYYHSTHALVLPNQWMACSVRQVMNWPNKLVHVVSSDAGVCDDPTAATAETGNALFEEM